MRLFKRPEVFNGYKKPMSPSDKGRLAHDQLIAGVQIQNYNLRIIIILLSVAFIIQSACNVYLLNRPAVKPYVVTVSENTGNIKFAGLIEDQKYVPKREELEYFLREFIRNTREIPLDPVVYNNNKRRAAALMTQDALNQMEPFEKSEKLRFGKETVQINIDTIIPNPDSNNSYRVQWHESSYDIGSGSKKVIYMTGLFTFVQIAPKDKKTAELNPLGIYIAGFNWDKDASNSKGGK